MPFGSLWLPVVLSAVSVWIATALAWMVLPHHKSDFKPLPDEDGTMAALRGGRVEVGVYSFPHCSAGAGMKDPAFQAKMNQGPVGMLTVMPSGVPNMGRALGLHFTWCFVAVLVTAYVARHSLGFGAPGMNVFRLTATVSFMAYSFAGISDSVWMGRPWCNTAKQVADGIVYACITGALFTFLWPAG